MLSEVVRKQLPFATAMALNDVAFEARKAAVKALSVFTLRGKFLENQVRVSEKATKAKLASAVGVTEKAKFL